MSAESNFVANIVTLRTAAGMSQTAFARAVAERGHRFHQPTVTRIESGDRPVRIDEAYAIADALGSSFLEMASEDLATTPILDVILAMGQGDGVASLTAERDRARDLAVALEQELAEVRERVTALCDDPDPDSDRYVPGSRVLAALRRVEASDD